MLTTQGMARTYIDQVLDRFNPVLQFAFHQQLTYLFFYHAINTLHVSFHRPHLLHCHHVHQLLEQLHTHIDQGLTSATHWLQRSGIVQYTVDALSSNLPGPCLYCIGPMPPNAPPSDHTSLQCRLHVCPACGIRSPGHDSRHCPHPVTGASYTSHAGFSPTLRSPISEMEGTETLSHPQGRERLATLLEAARRSIATQGMLSTASDSAGPLGN